MKITNEQGLPQAIVDAVTANEYTNEGWDFSITDLIRPPQINQLTREHASELTEDAADRIWALLGSSIHSVLENYKNPAELSEVRLYGNSCGKIISGQFDNFILDDGILTDYKVTSVWSVKGEIKPEWERQLNYYAELARQNAFDVKKLQIIAILRDWSKARMMQSPDYPRRNVVVLDVPLWDEGFTAEEMTKDTFEQIEATDGNARPCTDAERWVQPGKVAHMKKGRKSAVKLYDTVAEANAAIAGMDDGHYIIERPTIYRRCEDYCAVSEFCEQFKGDDHAG